MGQPAKVGKALAGRVALVTGAGRGIGRAIALAYAAEGASLIVAARSAKELEGVCAEAGALGATAIALPTDLASAVAIENMIAETRSRFRRIDVLVNNAGLGQGMAEKPIRSLLDVEVETWDQMFAINARAPFLAMRAVIPHMVKQGRGSIINITTRLAYRVEPGNIPYGPSKAALDQLTRSAAAEFGDTGIRCNLLHPGGAIDTSIFTPDYRPRSRQMQPPSIVGPAAVWLASDASIAANGKTIDCQEWNSAHSPR